MKDRRTRFKFGLNKLYLPYYEALCSLLSDSWQPISGYRSFEDQDKLFSQGRNHPGIIVTRARGGFSFHNYGLATDWDHFVGEQWSPLTFEDPLWDEYIDACHKVGVKCIDWEKPHNQLPVDVSGRKLFLCHQDGGMDAVNAYLRGELHGQGPPAA